MAPILEFQVSALSTTRNVSIYIKGGFPDTCWTFHEVTIERNGKTINIIVTIQRSEDVDCAQISGFFEKNVSLGAQFSRGETYTVNVNSKITSFVMPSIESWD